jgi:hypothetical protein
MDPCLPPGRHIRRFTALHSSFFQMMPCGNAHEECLIKKRFYIIIFFRIIGKLEFFKKIRGKTVVVGAVFLHAR